MNDTTQNNYHYNSALQSNANKLRKEMTKAEASLWKYVLRNRQLMGYQFRRQRPVLNYIADFMCKELKLIIEVDGISHDWEETVNKDSIKQRALENAGFTVIRFKDEDILKNMEIVVLTLKNWITKNLPPTPATGR